MRLICLLSLIPIYLLAGCQSLGDHFNCMAEVDRAVPAQTQQRYVRTDTKCVKSNEQSLGGGMGTIYNPAQGDVNCSAVPIYETIVLNQAQRDAAYQQCRNGVANQRNQSAQNYSGSASVASQNVKTGYSDSDEKETPRTLGFKFLNCWDIIDNSTTGKMVYDQLLVKYLSSSNVKQLTANSNKVDPNQKRLLNNFYYEDQCLSFYKDRAKNLPEMVSLFQSQLTPNQTIRKDLADGKITIGEANQLRIKSLNQFAIQLKKLTGFNNPNWQPIDMPKGAVISPPPKLADVTKPAMPPPSSSASVSMDQAKQKCIDLGFKTGTETFGQCVLKVAK